MPLMVEGIGPSTAVPPVGGALQPVPGASRGRLAIGLLNNMPDAALKATERQFARLLAVASGATDVRLHLFSLDSVPRGAAAKAYLAGRYGGLAALEATALDGLIVTGAEPVAPSLTDEPYWSELTRVVDWAEQNTASTIWSCLAAHAAVLHLDGIARRRLPEKRFGLYECTAVSPDGLFSRCPGRSAGAPFALERPRRGRPPLAWLPDRLPLARSRHRLLHEAMGQPVRLPAGPPGI